MPPRKTALEELAREETAAAAAAPQPPPPLLDDAAPGDLAFLLYTSGSTSEPKGVMITHGALAHNLATIVSSLRAGPDTVVVSWLPQYHDMGLIGSYLGVLACSGAGVYTSPLDFLEAPLSWLQLRLATHLLGLPKEHIHVAYISAEWAAFAVNTAFADFTRHPLATGLQMARRAGESYAGAKDGICSAGK
jgi:acyl-CoA synthetase (AMP-forming)/AMP-acid ligase II